MVNYFLLIFDKNGRRIKLNHGWARVLSL